MPVEPKLVTAVTVVEPYDVVQLGGRNLEKERVLDRAHAMYSPWPKPEALARRHEDADCIVGRGPQLDLSPPLVDVDGFVLSPVELETQLLARAHIQQLAAIAVCHCIDQLIAPGLVHTTKRLPALGEHIAAFVGIAHERIVLGNMIASSLSN